MFGTLVSLINPALAILSAFKGSAAEAKLSDAVQDAAALVHAVTPFITQHAAGYEVTEADVRASLAGKDTALAAFDALIAAKGE